MTTYIIQPSGTAPQAANAKVEEIKPMLATLDEGMKR